MPETKHTVSLEETEEMEKARELVKLAIYELKDRGYDYHLSMIAVLNTVLDYIYNHSCGEDDEDECSGYIVEAAFDLLNARHAKETNKMH